MIRSIRLALDRLCLPVAPVLFVQLIAQAEYTERVCIVRLTHSPASICRGCSQGSAAELGRHPVIACLFKVLIDRGR
jgi:hypothetical protein